MSPNARLPNRPLRALDADHGKAAEAIRSGNLHRAKAWLTTIDKALPGLEARLNTHRETTL